MARKGPKHTVKLGYNRWAINVEGTPEGFDVTTSKGGRNYEVSVNGEPIGEAATLSGAEQVASAWVATWWEEAGAAPPVPVAPLEGAGEPSVYDPPGEREGRAVRMWLEGDELNGWSVIRRWPHQQRGKVLRRVAGNEADAQIALFQLQKFERAQGVVVLGKEGSA